MLITNNKRHSLDMNAAYHIIRYFSESSMKDLSSRFSQSFGLSLISDILRNQSISYLPSSGRYRAWREQHACSVARQTSRQTSSIRGALGGNLDGHSFR